MLSPKGRIRRRRRGSLCRRVPWKVVDLTFAGELPFAAIVCEHADELLFFMSAG
jgi:hypothetical protein